MRRLSRSTIVAVASSAVLATLIGPAALAAPPDRSTPSTPVLPATARDSGAPRTEPIPTIDPPTGLDVRLQDVGTATVVTGRSRIVLHPSVGESLAEQVTVRVSVRDPRSGRLIHGPEQAAEVGGDAAGQPVAVDASDGLVRIRIPVTKQQQQALAAARRESGSRAAARAVHVRLTQSADLTPVWPGREAWGVIESRARVGGQSLRTPSVPTRASGQTVTMKNSTASPLVLLAGPAQCIYDNYYASTQRTNQQSFLGSMNGAILPPGTSLTVAITKDDEDLDGYNNDFFYQQVIDDYEQAIQNGYAWLQASGLASLPQMDFPYSSDNPLGLPDKLWQSVGLFVGHALLDYAGQAGLWNATWTALAAQFPDYAEQITSFSLAISPAVDYAVAIFEVVIALAQGLYTLFKDGCDSNPGYFLIGATDMYHPWRTFAQVYNWNGGDIEAATDTAAKTTYVPMANGMIVNSLPLFPVDPAIVADNALGEVFLPSGPKGSPVFTFQQPPQQAQSPAVISVDPATRTVTCGLAPADAAALTANLASQTTNGPTAVLPVYPTPLWTSLATGATVELPPLAPAWPRDYLVGYHYIVPARLPTAAVYWSADGQDFSSSMRIPAGQTSVVLPSPAAGIPAANLVTCVVQAPEMWNITASPLPTQRGLLTGTMVPSNVAQGPDYPTAG